MVLGCFFLFGHDGRVGGWGNASWGVEPMRLGLKWVVAATVNQGAGEVGRNTVDVKLVGWERHDDSLGHKTALDFSAEPVADVADETGIGNERIKSEEEGRVAEAFEGGGGCGVQQHVGILAGDGEKQVHDTVGVSSVGDAELDRNAKDFVFECPVDEVSGDEFTIRNDHALIVAVDDRGGPNVDALDLTGGARHGDDIADADWSFQQKNDSANEVGDDFL